MSMGIFEDYMGDDTNMGVGAYYDSPEEKQIARLEKMVADLRAQLAACAAGPWRFDVENAPRDGSEVVGGWYEADGEFYHNKYHWDSRYEGWRWDEPQYGLVPFVVWTTMNPPQVTT